MSSRVVVTCSNGFEERGFHSREAAEQWIDDFARAQVRVPDLCDGEHTVKESDDEHIPTKQSRGAVRREGSGAKP